MASILIIEDDIVDLMAIKRSLVPLTSHDFSYASSLQEANQLMANDSFDLIFTDYYLGDGIATEITTTQSPVILMTGMVEMPNPEIAQHFEEILVKDIKHSHLNQIVLTIQHRFDHISPTIPTSAQVDAPLHQLFLSFGSDKTFFKEMLLELKKQLQSTLYQLLPNNLNLSDPNLRESVHKVKSQLLLGGFSDGAEIAENLEQILQEENGNKTKSIESLIRDMQKSLEEALSIIEAALQEL